MSWDNDKHIVVITDRVDEVSTGIVSSNTTTVEGLISPNTYTITAVRDILINQFPSAILAIDTRSRVVIQRRAQAFVYDTVMRGCLRVEHHVKQLMQLFDPIGYFHDWVPKTRHTIGFEESTDGIVFKEGTCRFVAERVVNQLFHEEAHVLAYYSFVATISAMAVAWRFTISASTDIVRGQRSFTPITPGMAFPMSVTGFVVYD